MSGRRIGVYGGTFDPIHRGHLEPVLAAWRELALDQVLYVPTGVPPHRRSPLATPLARWTMVELALLPWRELAASAIELRDDRPSYTFATLERLAAERPGDRLVLLIGDDAFAGLPGWREWQRLVELAEIGVLTRPGGAESDDGWKERLRDSPAELQRAAASGRIRRVDNPPVALSSTEVRRRLAEGEPLPAGTLSPLVLDYIRKYGLYGTPDSAPDSAPGAAPDGAPSTDPGSE